MQRVNPGERVALYYRVSTEEQDRFGLSLDAQREALTDYAQKNKLTVVGEYRDGGFSARKKWKSRPAFVELIQAVEAEKIDVILFLKLDRWFRSISDYYEVQKILDAHNVRWIAIQEDYDTTTANGRLNLNIKLSIAQDEADRTSERIKFVFEEKRKKGEVLSGSVPLGMKIEDKKLVPDENAPLIVEAFDLFLSSRSAGVVHRWLLSKDVKITYRSIRRLLSNERYIGIVPEKVFADTQEILQQRAQRHSTYQDRTYLFSGLVYCSECGRALNSDHVRGHYYYRCRTYLDTMTCTPHRVPEPMIEEYLLGNLRELLEREVRIRSAKVQPDRTPAIKAQISRLQELYIEGLIDMPSYRERHTALTEALQRQKPIEIPKVDEVVAPLSLYKTFSREGKKAFWSHIVKKITVNAAEVKAVEFNV